MDELYLDQKPVQICSAYHAKEVLGSILIGTMLNSTLSKLHSSALSGVTLNTAYLTFVEQRSSLSN